ncbi:MAG: hypothetical protein HZA19_00220 [Nitrospirae bacterium]|nr:hypothetical protein [Nitrospirota bacterium]
MTEPALNPLPIDKTFDPYDLWSTSIGITARRLYYLGDKKGVLFAASLGFLDWWLPGISRRAFGVKPRHYPIVIAHNVLRFQLQNKLSSINSSGLLQLLRSVAVDPSGSNGIWAWGLGFPWMSKNGLYPPNIPFITHTPYVMEALLRLADFPEIKHEATSMFTGTWAFLESLKVMHKGDYEIALSYAPVDEPRIVVNANSYASFAYALHTLHGETGIKAAAKEKAIKLARWVINQQQPDGSWYYYADSEKGNFIDCFHTSFVIKNLIKATKIIPEISHITNKPIEQGWEFLNTHFFDNRKGLCRRFVDRDTHDPYSWDIYDQSEYLGLLIDFGLVKEASVFRARVVELFNHNSDWWCRRDILGRRWGKNYMRWGITPFLYHSDRLDSALEEGRQ